LAWQLFDPWQMSLSSNLKASKGTPMAIGSVTPRHQQEGNELQDQNARHPEAKVEKREINTRAQSPTCRPAIISSVREIVRAACPLFFRGDFKRGMGGRNDQRITQDAIAAEFPRFMNFRSINANRSCPSLFVRRRVSPSMTRFS
jgi:hypothetical protein